ncbi:MAG: hypothetical protein DRQ78_04975 [Epsilonproteobacteria bacterium]|nr:MAG: hypothetical protein DRQ78_04975 [Campylobacterota bacterium]
MKVKYSRTFLIILLSTGMSFAGGKRISPEAIAVLPVSEAIMPIPVYVGVGFVAAGLSRDCPCSGDERLKDMTYGGILRLGWDFNAYFGIEARWMKASIEKDFSQTRHYGLYLKPQYHLSDAINMYGLIGYGETKVDYANGNRSSTLRASGPSYGAGIEYDLSLDESLGQYSRTFDGQGDQEKSWGLWLDFQHLLYNESTFNTHSNIITAGITYDF